MPKAFPTAGSCADRSLDLFLNVGVDRLKGTQAIAAQPNQCASCSPVVKTGLKRSVAHAATGSHKWILVDLASTLQNLRSEQPGTCSDLTSAPLQLHTAASPNQVVQEPLPELDLPNLHQQRKHRNSGQVSLSSGHCYCRVRATVLCASRRGT